jgi:hypothetical protein
MKGYSPELRLIPLKSPREPISAFFTAPALLGVGCLAALEDHALGTLAF